MRLRRALIHSPILWALPLVAFAMAQTNPSVNYGWAPHYGAARAAAWNLTAMLIVPLTCASCAVEGYRLRVGKILTRPHVRSTAMIVGIPIAASLIPPAALYLVGGAARNALAWYSVLSFLVTTAAWAILGLGIGLTLRAVIAVPLALIGTTAWMVLPAAITPVWVRHLNGVFEGCCNSWTTPAPSAMAAVSIFALTIAVIGTVLICAHTSQRRWTLALTVPVLVVGVLCAAAFVQSLGPEPVVLRSETTVCRGTAPRICLWSEHEYLRADVQEALEPRYRAWAKSGVVVPTTVTESLAEPRNAATGRLWLDDKPDPTSLALTAVRSVAGDDGCQATASTPSAVAAAAWLGQKADAVAREATVEGQQEARSIPPTAEGARMVSDSSSRRRQACG